MKLLLTIILLSNLSFGQKKSFYSINNELFELQGKWEYIGKIESSGQWVFSNKRLKHILHISVRKKEIFEFYNKDLSEFEFLERFYTWETDFWGKDDKNVEIEKIETNETDKFIIWRLKVIDQNMDNFILSGVRNNKLVGISLSDNNKNEPRSRAEKIDFIKKVYFKKLSLE